MTTANQNLYFWKNNHPTVLNENEKLEVVDNLERPKNVHTTHKNKPLLYRTIAYCSSVVCAGNVGRPVVKEKAVRFHVECYDCGSALCWARELMKQKRSKA